jgi:hypothetical protein
VRKCHACRQSRVPLEFSSNWSLLAYSAQRVLIGALQHCDK